MSTGKPGWFKGQGTENIIGVHDFYPETSLLHHPTNPSSLLHVPINLSVRLSSVMNLRSLAFELT